MKRNINEIIKTDWLVEGVREIWFSNPDIANKFKPGQFLIVRQDEKGERIPLTIVESRDSLVRIILQDVGYSTAGLCAMKEGDVIRIIREPYFGTLARVKSMPNELVKIETESPARVLVAEFTDGKTAIIPRANVELLED